MTEIKNLTVRPSPKLRAKLEEIAKAEGVSVARVIIQLIEEGLEAKDEYQDVQRELAGIKHTVGEAFTGIEKELAEIKARLEKLEG